MPHRERLGYLIAALLVAVSPATDAAHAEGLRGRSADLGFTFEALRSPWCGKVVEIALSAPDAAPYRRDRRALESALGRLRAAVLAPSECPRAQLIEIDAKADGETVLRATMAAFSRWVIVWDETGEGGPACFDGVSSEACRPYAAAYRLWREIALSDEAPALQLSTFLDTQRSTLAEWKAPGLTGQVIALPIEPHEPETSARLVAQALTENAAEACGSGWRRVKEEMLAERISRSAFSCKQPKGTMHEELVVAERYGYFFVFSTMATSPDPDRLRRFNMQLAAALAGIVQNRP